MTTKRRPTPFKNRTDADHVLRQIPRLGGRQDVHGRIMVALDDWEPGRGNVLICGPTKAGKTSGVVLRILDLLDERENATSTVFAEAQELVEDSGLRERAKIVRLLIVDDLGQEDDPKNRLFQIYNARYKAGLETLTTCGRRPEDLEARIGGAMKRRILDCSRRDRDGNPRLLEGAIVDVFARKERARPAFPTGHARNPRPFSEAAER